MLSGYAARDHRQMVIKQRRPDQGSHISPSGTASYRVDGYSHPLQPILIGSSPLSRKDANAIFSLLERR